MSSGCGDVLSLEDLKTAKKHQLFEAEVITGRQGGVASGANIDYATNQNTGQTQKTLPAILRDVGFNPASFDFTTGGTLGVNDRDKVVFDPVSFTWYSWEGVLPKVIPAGTNPLLDANWKPKTDPDLRSDLASTVTPGASLVGVRGGSLTDIISRAAIPLSQANGVIDNTATLQALLNAGAIVKLSKNHILKITDEVTFPVAGCGLIAELGAKIIFSNPGISAPIWFKVTAPDVVISGLECDFSAGNCYAGVRTYEGAKRFTMHDMLFKNVYGSNADNSQSVNVVWQETLNCELFKLYNLRFENIKCLGNGSEGDTPGSVTGILLRQYSDISVGGYIDNITADDIWCVDSSGAYLTEDADLIKSQGFSYCPVYVGSVRARNVGKRVIKNQAKGMVVESIIYYHDTTVPHRSVVAHQDSYNTVKSCIARGYIQSLYRAESPNATTRCVGCSFVGECDTNYTAADTPAAAIGVVDIGSGRNMYVKARVEGGQLGFRITTNDTQGTGDIVAELDIRSAYAVVVRNIVTANGGVDNITISGNLRSTANALAPGVNIFTSNSAGMGTVKLHNCKLSFEGGYSTGMRALGLSGIVLDEIEFNCPNSTSAELTNVTNIMVSTVTEKNTAKSTSVLRLQGVSGGSIEGVVGGVTSGSIGVIDSYGCSNLAFSNIRNISSGTAITFKNNGTTQNTACNVDGNTVTVTAPPAYNDSNVIWAGYPAYVPTTGLVGIVKRGSIARDTTTGTLKFWDGSIWS